MLLMDVLRKKKYAAIALFSSAAMLMIYPYAQTLGNNIDLWFEVISPINLALYAAFSLLFGPFVSLQVYNLKAPKTCAVQGAAGGTFSSVLSFAAIQCPGCVSVASLFLPISATTFLAANNIIITSASLVLLLAGIYLLGGFKPTKPKNN